MLDVILIFFFQNIFLLSGIFWLLSFLGEKFFKKKNSRFSEELFECGFSADHKYNLKINMNLFFIMNLLILYDVEFLFLVPFFYNISYASFFSWFIFLFFYTFIIISLLIDWSLLSLQWHF